MDDLSLYRLETAKDKLKSSKILLDAGQYNNAVELCDVIEKYLFSIQKP